ncbi:MULTISPECIES: DUF3885 domain-containing protein [unclassified Phaeobacter]|uniref:DUF3885 domain-containing protein n=1 Tax=unclassified Phaeobacter TaxID=2621772 RepID=UPI003A862C84
MEEFIQRFESDFTLAEFPHGMFYKFDIGLRFELGGEGSPTSRPLKRFAQAFSRADAVSSSLFNKSSSLWLLSSTYGTERPAKRRLKPYKLCGLTKSSFEYLGATPQKDSDHVDAPGSDLFRHWDVAKLVDKEQLREVLWLTLGSELGIKPTVHADTYIVDFEKSIALHPYDDRGMDVVSMDKENLAHLYDDHKSWLLEHDASRMKAVFEG